MGLKERNLADGEQIVLNLRTHPKAILLPVLYTVLLAAVLVLLWWFLRGEDYYVPVMWVAGGIALALAIWLTVLPILRWNAERYVITTRRVAHRTGILNRKGRDIPLHRVNDISLDKSLLDRIFRCGTLVISDATQQSGMVLHDVPEVARVQVQLHNLLYATDDGSDDGEWPPNEPGRRRGRR
ncbi:PH domain-containing protein [Ornithinimicrobium sp. Y1847]|uniref:PH domain-containing protein n=1 Tax=Ornithinimicrobium sp. Y1847 TaxID=3405419 RepID=UPI003B678FC2